MMPEVGWHSFVIKEIDFAMDRGRRLNDWEAGFYGTIKHRVRIGLSLSEKQENSLRKLHQKMTEPKRIKW